MIEFIGKLPLYVIVAILVGATSVPVVLFVLMQCTERLRPIFETRPRKSVRRFCLENLPEPCGTTWLVATEIDHWIVKAEVGHWAPTVYVFFKVDRVSYAVEKLSPAEHKKYLPPVLPLA